MMVGHARHHIGTCAWPDCQRGVFSDQQWVRVRDLDSLDRPEDEDPLFHLSCYDLFHRWLRRPKRKEETAS